ncbi:putative NBD/HSP70 family sugar kinase [Peribacillus deserti]|uniref:NBD/HSP70 family sugar kinase n=1 Tax=Peribacillus deserti TaxID=673318 RepID=A0ABS2QIE0_9BACI|nr:ROK family protein [Peribacillus deserti]MBM7692066.1 putative NBD/HSP70 family sugar kinase [Peribacillus deserti]
MKNYMVYDVGGSKVKYAVINENGDFLFKGDYPSAQNDFEQFQTDIIEVTLKNKELFNIEGIAFSCPGGVDSDTGIIGGASALPCIHGPNFKEIFGFAAGLPVEIENDANCAALGEVWKGAASENQNVMFTVIGTGIGGAVIKDRKIHKGANLHGGEIGYMVLNVIDENGEYTFKTWSELAATGSLVKKVAKIKGLQAHELNGQKIFEAAEAGDEDCRKAIDEFYLSLAQGIYNIQYVYDPEKIILGGAISSREDLIDEIYKKLDLIIGSIKIAKVRPVIETCQYKNDANLLGALYHFLQCQETSYVPNI